MLNPIQEPCELPKGFPQFPPLPELDTRVEPYLDFQVVKSYTVGLSLAESLKPRVEDEVAARPILSPLKSKKVCTRFKRYS